MKWIVLTMTSPPVKPFMGWRFVISPQLLWMCAIAVVMSLFWWQVALALRGNEQFLVWDDQKVTFLRGLSYIDSPYTIPGFVNPPWTLIILAPLNVIGFDIAILLQIIMYFVLLALLLRKFGGGVLAAIVVFTSPLAPDAVINLNIDWIVIVGLLIPQAWSAPLLLAKPQNALGYIMSFKRQIFAWWIIGALITTLISLLVWGWWVPDWLTQLEVSPVTWTINLAPRALMGDTPAQIAGFLLAIYAFRRRDPVLGIFSGLFFVPYIASYSMLMPFALLATRSRIAAVTGSVSTWAVVLVVVNEVFNLL